MSKILATLASIAVAAATPLAAQQHQHPRTVADSASRVASGDDCMRSAGRGGMEGMAMTGMRMGVMASDTMAGAHARHMEGMPIASMAGMQWMMDASWFAPRTLLRLQPHLGLDQDQTATLHRLADLEEEALRDSVQVQGLWKRMRSAFESSPPDTASLRTALVALATLHADRLGLLAAARATLTPVQREKAAREGRSCGRSAPAGDAAASHAQHHDG